MSKLFFETLTLPGRKLCESAWYPAARELIRSEISAELDEDDGLFIGYGMLYDSLPYTMQDSYDSPVETLSFQSIVLENEYLKAVFLPELGGRLWSLCDKESGRDLILRNTAFLPCNLAIRNAWIAGGVEFNCGRRGHDEQTCSPRFTAVIDGETPVLRFYEFQRDRCVPFQYDCFLPDNSRFLYIRGRIWNKNREVVPMYWWSNIAMPEVNGSRIVVPAFDAFANWYSNGSHALAKLTLPDGEGFDATYPANFEYVKDHFYNIPENTRHYECLFMPDGYGLCYASTKRLRGRKLFVWGQSQGGRHWNRKLLGPGLDSYIEIQGGLGRSQQECLPMPPRTAWEWMEAYGAIRMKPSQVFGSWKNAVEETTAEVDRILPEDRLEKLFRETHDSIALKPGRAVVRGSGWGALEEMREGRKMTAYLDFGTPGDEQRDWVSLLKNNFMDDSAPKSYQIGNPWLDLLNKAESSWKTEYHIALNWFRKNDLERAEEHLKKIPPSAVSEKYTAYLLANIRRNQHDKTGVSAALEICGRHTKNDASFLKEILKMYSEIQEYSRMLELIEAAQPEIQTKPLILFMKAAALAHTGRLSEAEAILLKNGGLEIPDIREGENSTSGLYFYIQQMKAHLRGVDFDPGKKSVPFKLDLRMSRS